MKAAGLTQRELAPKLGIDPTTLNNFLNHQSKALGGLAVALACTVVDVLCDGTKIGRILQKGDDGSAAQLREQQLVLEFDAAFEVLLESEHPTIILRKPVVHNDGLRLSIKRMARTWFLRLPRTMHEFEWAHSTGTAANCPWSGVVYPLLHDRRRQRGVFQTRRGVRHSGC